ncbi:phospho-sugar mutase [Spiroplasma endosymbiont of Aspidapion aeneum]|uniref:phospho-sugar mutase n=1 Tax=Spiroplasma endosymbiont of Aspidapion aeneum TaxID=3066276 RepID=UPI00313A890D
MSIKNNKQYKDWIENVNVDEELKNELKNMNQNEIKFAFENKLTFGTAGIRGILGVGPGKFNIFTIRSVTRAYARLIRNKFKDCTRKIVIGHDNRHKSKEFAMEAAKILSSYDINVLLFKDNEMRPTPVVSFLTSKLQCSGGIVITASHNPKEYNGYKIYDEFGCQLVDEETQLISEYMEKYDDILNWKYIENNDKIKYVCEKDEDYYNNIISDLQFFKNDKKNLTVIYSAVNGTGTKYVPKFLSQSNFNVIEVKEHAYEDPDFINVGNPNPEFEKAWEIPLIYAKKNKDADIIVITDPDADRLGVAVKHDGKWHRLNGNETGPLLIEWRLKNLKERNLLPKNPALYSSFVTSNLGDRVANEKYGVKIIKTLTGFKWMASEILKEEQRDLNFVFAYEESFGYVIDKSTKDKDGIQAAMAICEAAWYYKVKENKTLIDKLDDLYKEFGYYYTKTINLNFKPEELKLKIEPIIEKMRNEQFGDIDGIDISFIEDYKEGLFNMPSQNLLKFYFVDNSWFAIRPSGTEPKVKIYFVCVDSSMERAKQKFKSFSDFLSKFISVKF